MKILDREDLDVEKRRLTAASSSFYDAAIKLMNKSNEELELARQRLRENEARIVVRWK